MRKVIINNNQMSILQNFLNEGKKEMTYYAFNSHIKSYLKKLLTEPISAQPDDFLKSHDLNGEKLLSHLRDYKIVERDTKINNDGNKDKFVVKYKIPRQNFERKMRRLYSFLFESNIVDENLLNEDGCAGAMGGDSGATTADASGQYTQPLFGKPLRRKIYVTEEQYEKLKNLKEEAVMNTPVGDFGYDAPAFAEKGDPTLDHKNIMAKSFKGYDRKRKSNN